MGRKRSGTIEPPRMNAQKDQILAEPDEDDTLYSKHRSQAGGIAFTSRPMTAAQMYVLDWEQIRRLVVRCGYWHAESVAEEMLSCWSMEEQKQAVTGDLQKLYQRIDEIRDKRYEFARNLGDAVLSKFEGPRGLGSTSKGEFETAVYHTMRDLKIQIPVNDMNFLTKLQQWENPKRRLSRRVTRPTLADHSSTETRKMQSQGSESELDRDVAYRPSCNEQ